MMKNILSLALVILISGFAFADAEPYTPFSIENFNKRKQIVKNQLVTNANREMINKVISGTIAINSVDASGATALVHAATIGDLKAVNKLIEMGIDVNKQKHNGSTALIAASQTGEHKVVEKLIDSGADIETLALDGKINALYQAVDYVYPQVVEVLLKNGANPNPQTSVGSPLRSAVLKNNVELARMLIEAGADTNSTYKNHRAIVFPILHSALQGPEVDSYEIVKLLLDHGANPNGKTYVDVNSDIKKELPKYAVASFSILGSAISRKKSRIVKLLISMNVNLENISDEEKMMLMTYYIRNARETGEFNDLKTLLASKAFANIRDIALFNDFTIPNVGDGRKAFKLLKLLSEAGADFDRYYFNGDTPLIAAVKNDNYEIAKYLLKLGVDANKQEKLDGNTALHYGASDNKTYKMLLKFGAKTNIKNIRGITPSDLKKEKDERDRIEAQKIAAQKKSQKFNWGELLTGVATFAQYYAEAQAQYNAANSISSPSSFQLNSAPTRSSSKPTTSAIDKDRQFCLSQSFFIRSCSKYYCRSDWTGANYNVDCNGQSLEAPKPTSHPITRERDFSKPPPCPKGVECVVPQ